MSGHSKWHNIQAKKGKADAARGKVFTKIGRELAVAIKEGGPNPETNSRLSDVIAKAKANNMPNDNIQRILKKAQGDSDANNYEEITYEGYGPAGVAVIIEALTDNRNRTAGDVRHFFDRSGGNMGTSGCVSYMFEKKGLLVVEKNDSLDEDDFMMMALEAGADDFSSDEEVFEITTAPDKFSEVRGNLEKNGISFLSAELSMIPNVTVALNSEDAEKIERMVERFEDSDDIQNIWHNAEFPEGFGE